MKTTKIENQDEFDESDSSIEHIKSSKSYKKTKQTKQTKVTKETHPNSSKEHEIDIKNSIDTLENHLKTERTNSKYLF